MLTVQGCAGAIIPPTIPIRTRISADEDDISTDDFVSYYYSVFREDETTFGAHFTGEDACRLAPSPRRSSYLGSRASTLVEDNCTMAIHELLQPESGYIVLRVGSRQHPAHSRSF